MKFIKLIVEPSPSAVTSFLLFSSFFYFSAFFCVSAFVVLMAAFASSKIAAYVIAWSASPIHLELAGDHASTYRTSSRSSCRGILNVQNHVPAVHRQPRQQSTLVRLSHQQHNHRRGGGGGGGAMCRRVLQISFHMVHRADDELCSTS